MNYNTSQLVNFEVKKDMISGKSETELVTVNKEKLIKRKKNAGGGVVSIITEPEDKLYRISFSRDGD